MQGRKFKQITQEERIRIEVLLQQGSSYSKIACLLKRSVSTISREIRRNSSVAGKRPVYYCARIILGKNRQPGLLVVLDRKSRKTWLRKLKTKEAGYVIDKIKDVCSKITHRIKTITLDNDQSFAQHYRLNKESGIKTYFTHPYSSQEKGSVENRIGIIRMFFGKKTDFTKVSRAKVKTVENIINNRALKLFNYKTPNELYEKKLCIY